MLKLLSIITYFFRELVFDYKEEYDFKSSKFNVRKVGLFLILLSSISLNWFLVVRVYHLSKANIELRKVIPVVAVKNNPIAPSDSKSSSPGTGVNPGKK
jgi:hypothetical protein